MSKIKLALRIHKAGISNRRIVRELGQYKDTVNKYVKMAGPILGIEQTSIDGRSCLGVASYG